LGVHQGQADADLSYIDLKYFDLGIECRDKTVDQMTGDASHVIRDYGAGVDCATISPDEARSSCGFGCKRES